MSFSPFLRVPYCFYQRIFLYPFKVLKNKTCLSFYCPQAGYFVIGQAVAGEILILGWVLLTLNRHQHNHHRNLDQKQPSSSYCHSFCAQLPILRLIVHYIFCRYYIEPTPLYRVIWSCNLKYRWIDKLTVGRCFLHETSMFWWSTCLSNSSKKDYQSTDVWTCSIRSTDLADKRLIHCTLTSSYRILVLVILSQVRYFCWMFSAPLSIYLGTNLLNVIAMQLPQAEE